jgi:hypothetical protein
MSQFQKDSMPWLTYGLIPLVGNMLRSIALRIL